MLGTDPSLLPWDKFPKTQLVRADQDLNLIFIDRERVDYQLTNKNSGLKVDQVFNLQTGMVERITATDKDGALQEEYVWLGAYKNPDSVWLPRAMIHMKMGPAIVELQARVYWKWQLRPVTSNELVIPTTEYHKIIELPKKDEDKKGAKKDKKPQQQKGNFKVQQ